jgi:nucleotide-binding universal stress UspA family protein
MARSSLFRNILVPHDFSPQATAALRTAAQSVAEKVVRHAAVPVLTLRVPVRKRSPRRQKK